MRNGASARGHLFCLRHLQSRSQRFCDAAAEACRRRSGGGTSIDHGPTAPAPSAYTLPPRREDPARRPSLEGERRTVHCPVRGCNGLHTNLGAARPGIGLLADAGLCRPHDGRSSPLRGPVTQFLGDGVLALFGAPIQHEDSARRAIAAALDMQRSSTSTRSMSRRSSTIDCRFRVGLNTGPVIVGSIGDNLDMDYTANRRHVQHRFTARDRRGARQRVPLRCDPPCAEDYFEFEDLGALELKGKGEPVPAFRALREKSIRTRSKQRPSAA